MNKTKPYQILVVEDNEADQHLIEYLFSSCTTPVELIFASNGDEARNRMKHSPLPDLILMDLNVPLGDGRALIREFKADPNACRVPIVMMSTSSSEREVIEAYCLGANSFIPKQTDLDTYQEKINTLVAFWFSCVILPTRPGPDHAKALR